MSVAATLRPEQAGGRCWDVIVLGAGPAGALAARQLALMGKSVLLVDKRQFPRWKVCGCCLNARALATLGGVGLDRLIERCGAVPLHNIQLATATPHPPLRRGEWGVGRAVLPLSGQVAVSREALDTALVGAAIEAGAAFLPGVLASLGEDLRMARCVVLQQGQNQQKATARLVLAAVGLGGLGLASERSLAAAVEPGSRIGAGVVVEPAPDFYRPGSIYMACGPGGYLGLVRREDGKLNLAAALDPVWVKGSGGLGRAAAALLALVGWPAISELSELAWRGTPALTRQPARLGAVRVLVLGDAAGYVEPFTGEGIAWALAAGAAVAPLARRASHGWSPEWVQQWTARHAAVVGKEQRLCRWAMRVLRRPILVHLLITAAAHAPSLASPILRCLERKSEIVS